MKKSTITATFTSPIEKVWNTVTDNTNFAWRSDISKVVVSDDKKKFSEFTNKGFKTKFFIMKKEECKRYEFSIENKNISGYWIGIFSQNGEGTEIEFTEQIEALNPIVNLFASKYLKKQQDTYISDLRKALGE